MLVGTADVARLAEGAPTLESLDTEALALPGAALLQVMYEIESSALCELLPPALHPTLPPVVNWNVYRFPQTPWGPVQLAQTRIQCRSGLRPRALLLSGVVDNGRAAGELASRWGFRLREGAIEFRSGYGETRVSVSCGGEIQLELGGRSPHQLSRPEVQVVASLHPAQTPRGFRLVQVDPDHELARVDRLEPFLNRFEARAWGDARVKPVYPVSASLALGDVTLPRLRYVCRADVSAFEGTESVGQAA